MIYCSELLKLLGVAIFGCRRPSIMLAVASHFATGCTLLTPSGVFSGTIATGGAQLPIIASFGRHLEIYSDGSDWVIMRSSGDTSSITATTLGSGNVA